MTAPDDLLVVAEVAELTRVPAGTFRSWRHTDEGPPSFKLGRRVVYRRADVMAWIERQRESTTRGQVAS